MVTWCGELCDDGGLALSFAAVAVVVAAVLFGLDALLDRAMAWERRRREKRACYVERSWDGGELRLWVWREDVKRYELNSRASLAGDAEHRRVMVDTMELLVALIESGKLGSDAAVEEALAERERAA